jgi:hypothetical protein
MAYAVTNPPELIVQGITTGTNKVSIWKYSSVDVATLVDDVGYFTNGNKLGMRVGDLVIVLDNDTSTTMTLHRVITSTAGGAVTVSTTGLTVT